jgi:hypothetical protein
MGIARTDEKSGQGRLDTFAYNQSYRRLAPVPKKNSPFANRTARQLRLLGAAGFVARHQV